MANVQLAVAGDDNTQVILSVPGVQGPAGSNLPPSGTTNQVLYKQSNTDYDTAWSFVTSVMIANGTIVDEDVNASAAIAGTKISPDFGSQSSVTTGTSTAASFIPTSSTVPTNGVYLPSANNVAISTNSSRRLLIDASGQIGIGVSPSYLLDVASSVVQLGSSTDAFVQYKSTAGNWHVGANSSNAYAFYSGTYGTGTEWMRLDSSGRLGLGTSSPAQLLHIKGSGDAKLLLNSSNNASDRGIYFATSTDSEVLGYIKQEYSTGKFEISSGSGSYSSSISFRTGGTADRVVIDSTGKVGIGTTGPLDSLSIAAANYRGLTLETATLANRPTITFRNTGGAGDSAYIQGNNYELAFGRVNQDYGGHTEHARIDSSGRLLVGTSSTSSVISTNSALQIYGTTYDTASLSIRRSSSAGADSAGLYLGRERAGGTAVANNDRIGLIGFAGHNGSTLDTPAAFIECWVDGAVSGGGAGDMPGRLVFSTTADGASSPTERFILNRVGDAVFSNTSTVYPATDNAAILGGSSNRWSAIWAANGTIQTSDQRAKTEITTAHLGSDFIKSLRPVSYKWIDGGQIDSGRRDEDSNYIYESVPGTRTHWGFIAQEVKEAVDAAGVDFGGWVLTDKDDPDSQQALRYDQFIAPLTKALQEALAKIETLEAKVAALEAA